MNPMMIFSGLKFFAVLGMGGYALMSVNSYMEDQREQRIALQQAQAEKVVAQARTNSLKQTLDDVQTAHAYIEEAREKVEGARARQEAAGREEEDAARKEQAIATGKRLQNILDGRPESMERLVNRATRKRFERLEEIINGEE